MKREITVVLEVDEEMLRKAYKKERPSDFSTNINIKGMLKDQMHWVKASGIKLKSIQNNQST